MPIQAHRLSRAPFLSDLIPILICNNNKHEFSPKPHNFLASLTNPKALTFPYKYLHTEKIKKTRMNGTNRNPQQQPAKSQKPKDNRTRPKHDQKRIHRPIELEAYQKVVLFLLFF